MDKIKKILAPTDLSELSRVGVRYALDLARAIGAEVTVYHVLSPGDLMELRDEIERVNTTNYMSRQPRQLLEMHRTALSRFLKEHFSDLLPLVETREKVEMGKADKSIVNLAKTEGSDLIVISTHGRTGLSHVLVGSVTEKVVRQAPCPVLSIHPQPGQKAAQEAAFVI